MADLLTQIPQDIEDRLDDALAPGRLLVGKKEQQIDVGARRERAAPIAADGDDGQPLGEGRIVGRHKRSARHSRRWRRSARPRAARSVARRPGPSRAPRAGARAIARPSASTARNSSTTAVRRAWPRSRLADLRDRRRERRAQSAKARAPGSSAVENAARRNFVHESISAISPAARSARSRASMASKSGAREIGPADAFERAQPRRRGHVDLGQPAVDHVDADEDQPAPFQLRPEPRADFLLARVEFGRRRRAAAHHIGADVVLRRACG